MTDEQEVMIESYKRLPLLKGTAAAANDQLERA